MQRTFILSDGESSFAVVTAEDNETLLQALKTAISEQYAEPCSLPAAKILPRKVSEHPFEVVANLQDTGETVIDMVEYFNFIVEIASLVCPIVSSGNTGN